MHAGRPGPLQRVPALLHQPPLVVLGVCPPGWLRSPEGTTKWVPLARSESGPNALCMLTCAFVERTWPICCSLSSALTASGPWLGPGEPAFSLSCFHASVKQQLFAEWAQIGPFGGFRYFKLEVKTL